MLPHQLCFVPGTCYAVDRAVQVDATSEHVPRPVVCGSYATVPTMLLTVISGWRPVIYILTDSSCRRYGVW